VRRDGPHSAALQPHADDWTARLAAIPAAAELIKAKSFTIESEAILLGPDGLSWFEELSRCEAARTAILYASTLSSMMAMICAIFRSFTAKRRWRDCCAIPRPASCGTNTSPRMGRPFLRMRAGLGRGHRVEEGRAAPTCLACAASGAIPPASRCSGDLALPELRQLEAKLAGEETADRPHARNLIGQQLNNIKVLVIYLYICSVPTQAGRRLRF
jgi:hypothetical protein